MCVCAFMAMMEHVSQYNSVVADGFNGVRTQWSSVVQRVETYTRLISRRHSVFGSFHEIYL